MPAKSFAALPFVIAAAALFAAAAAAEPAAPLVPHRAAYDITLADAASAPSATAQTPVGARGMIAYEFQGSACEGYVSNFRQATELLRGEGEPIDSEINAMTFEDGKGQSMRFEIGGRGAGVSPPVVGRAARAPDGATKVDLAKPETRAVDLGADVYFPTQHMQRLIAAAKAGETTVKARVYDGSDTGAKVYDTLSILGKTASGPGRDAAAAPALAEVPRWPVTVSYFDEAAKDPLPEYILSFDLYENGVSGSLKLDYGTFALNAKLRTLELLPVPACAN